MAFIQVAAGVFQMRASHMLVPLEQESAEAESMASGEGGEPAARFESKFSVVEGIDSAHPGCSFLVSLVAPLAVKISDP